MQHSLAARDVRALYQLQGALTELASHSTEEALGHLTSALPRLLGDAVVWWSAMRAPLEPLQSRVHGLDASTLRRWEQGYLLEAEYAQHPMWPSLLAGDPSAGVTRRRDQVVSDRDWYRSPHIAEWCRGLGYDDVVAGVVPLRPSAKVPPAFGFMAMIRPWGEPRFTDRDVAVLHAAHQSCRWLTRQALLDAGTAKREALRDGLPAHIRRVHAQLLKGYSEKEIGAALGLSTRTVHKYVERIYQAFEVQSRARFMALWVDG